MGDAHLVDQGRHRWTKREAKRVAENPARSMVAIGIRLKATREMLDLQASHVARDCRIDRSTLCHYEKGVRFPALDQLSRIAEVYDLPLDWIALGRLRFTAHDFADIILPLIERVDPTLSCVDPDDLALVRGD